MRLETVLFRRMVHMLVSLEGLDMEANGKAGDAVDGDSDDRPLPVGSIRIDDSMTLSQAREEIFKQLGAHVELPRFQVHGGVDHLQKPERRRTVAESLSLHPAQSKLEGVRRVYPGLRVLGKYGDSLLDGISEGARRRVVRNDDDTVDTIPKKMEQYLIALYRRSGKRRAGRRWWK